MCLRFLVRVLSVFSLPFAAGAADVPLVRLGGEVGAADKASLNRFSSVPYDSLAWIRADLTGEKASESDDAGWGHILFRPFKNYSGDISGRFIEIMAMNARGDYNVHPAFRQLLADAQKQQRPGGYFAAGGLIDWQKPIDYKDIYTSTMMPALWGNARLLCGLVEASRSFPNDAPLLATARRLGDFYVGIIPRFTDPARMSEYKGGDTYAAGYVTCYFPAMEGLAKLHTLTGDKKYLEAAVTMAAFYKQFDRVPIDHAHGMLCNQVSLVLLYEASRDVSYLERVEKRWDELVTGGYINPAGGIMEQCKVQFGRDEGCAIVDWLRLNLALGRVTGKTRYWAMAERTLHNHFLQNQTPKGGFGHRGSLCDQEGVYGFSDSIEEAVWCCTFHGQLGFVNLRSHLLNRTAVELTCNFAVDFTAKYADGSVVSDILPVAAAGEVLRQRIRLDGLPATVLRVRQPHWADAVTALAADGTALGLETRDGYCLTTKPVSEATFIYAGGLYAEDRHCKRLPAGPVAGAAGVIGYGPKLLAAQGRTAAAPTWPTTIEALKAQGLEPFTAALRDKECCFVNGPLSLAVSAKPVWGTSPIAEPYPYVSTGSFTGPAEPLSPDPLVAYRWPSPKATDGLEIYLLKPTTVSSDTAASFDNLGSLTTDHPNVTVNGSGSIRMDFGRESAAWLEFDSPDCPGGIEMSISEYNQPAIVNQMPLHPVKTLAPVKYGNTYRLELNKELYEGVRFGWIHVRSFTGVWHITGIRLVCQVKPVNYKGSFSCSDPMLTRVWYTGAYGVKLNLLKDYLGAILMDRGDRHSWTGDAHPSQAASMAAFGNFDFIRSNLERTSGKDWIQSYMLYWVSSMLDYYNYTGDTELLKKYTENISAKLDDAYTAYGTNPKLGFYGHDERIGACFEIQTRDSREAQHAYKMLSIRAWNDFAKAMESIGRADLRDKYNGYVTEKVSQLRQNATWYQDFGVHAMSDAVNAGFTSRTEQEKMFALEYNDKVNRVSFSPFNQYFIIQAMASMKKHDEALDSVRYLWGGMIEYGGTTFFEAFRPAWATVLGKNDPVPACQCGFTSLCHPWGGGVVKWLSEEVAGIKPVSPGFKEYAIVPHLGRSLTWAKGTVPTPHGEIGMSINVDSGEMSMSAPAGTIGRLGIPKMEKTIRSIVFDNVVVWDGVFHAANGVGGAEEDPDFVYLTKVQPGTHAITVKYSGTTPGYVEPLEYYDVDCIRQDSATGGSWGGKYGAEGYVLFSYNGANNDVRALPSYVNSLDYYNHRSVQWTNQTSDLRALSPDKSNGVPRKAACIHTGNGGPTDIVRSWDGQPLTVAIEVNGTRSYQVAFYFVDWDKLGRSIAVEMFDAKTLKMVAPVQVIKDHVAGCYLIYQYDKSVKFRIQQIRGGNTALGGIFFDPAPLAALHAADPLVAVERDAVALPGGHRDDPAQTGVFTINLSDIRVRDPFIVADRASKTYYLYAQCGNRQNKDSLGLGVEVYASKDLVKWSAPLLAFERPKSGFWGGSDIWAPEVHQFGKSYFMFVTFPGRSGGRGTQILRADRPEGPFQILGDSANTPPEEQCLDGTPWIDEHGVHWMVYCNEWTSIKDGTVRAVPMTDDWTARKGESILLFRASEAPWVRPFQPGNFVTDGPFLHRTKSGKLLMIWSSFVKGHGYGVGQAISKSGSVAGPWMHLEKPLVGGGGEDGGHCMIFRDFSGELLLAFHQPNGGSLERPKIYRLKEENDALVLNGALLSTTTGYAKGPTEAFLMAYFVGDSVEENRLHLCWSLDGLKWTALNNDKPVVTSSMSTKAIRDPAILRKQDGAFVLMYTDSAWSVGQKPTCGFWDSPDLVNWTNQRICTLSGNPAVPAWGPEAIYDPASGKYIVLWSTSASDSLWYNTTTDFNTFSPEARFFSPGYQVLESKKGKMPQGEIIARMLVFKDVLNFELVHSGWYREGEGSKRRKKL